MHKTGDGRRTAVRALTALLCAVVLGFVSGISITGFLSEADAAITNLNQWSATATADGTTNPLTGSFTVAAGTNRLLVVSVEYETSAVGAHTVAVTYGTRPLTQIVNNVAQRQNIWIGYLAETDLAAASNTTISSTITLAGGATLTRQTIHAATYSGVHQTTPVVASNNQASASATSLTYTNIGVTNGGYILYVWNFNTTATGQQASNNGTGYTEHFDQLYTTYNLSIASKAIAATGTETVTVTSAQAANRCALSVVSLNPVPTLQFSAATYTVAESGPTATITVTRTGGTTGAVGVTYATSNGTATAGADYTAATSTLSWADGDAANKTFTVAITDDALDENDETVSLTLSAPTGGATLGTQSTATLTITDNDPTPTVQFAAAASSGSEATTPAVIAVNLSAASGLTVTVNYATANGTATAPADYTATSGTLTFNPGVTTQNINVPILDDAAVEADETFTVTLTGPTNATPGTPATHTYTILNNDVSAGTLQFSAATYTVAESGPTATITVTRTGGTTGAVGVTYATSNGTATAGADYTAATSTLSWVDGDAANKTFTVAITDDALDENNETVSLTLSAPTGGATLGAQSTATLTITDNDPTPTVQFAAAASSGSEAATPAVIAVNLSAASGLTVTVNYATANGTATAPADYTVTSGTLTFNPGVTAQNINVPIINDTAVEADETFTVTLTAPTNATLGTTATHTFTIIDNDGNQAPTLSGAVSPTAGDTNTIYTFSLTYTDANNDGPAAGFPKVYIGDADGYFAYALTLDTAAAATLRDGNYANGEQYVYIAKLGSATDVRYYFEARAAAGDTALVTSPAGAPTSFSSVAVWLIYAQNMVGVPKDLSAGMPYTSVLGDDTAQSWCYTYESTGLFTGSYVSCAGSNLVAGRGYLIWATLASGRLDEPVGVGNVAAASFDIPLQAGWNLISNPYTERIALQGAAGPRVNVVNTTTSQEVDFATAVTNGWVYSTVYEWQGSVNGYVGSIFNGTPAAVLEPWKGYWIHVQNTASTFALRVHR